MLLKTDLKNITYAEELRKRLRKAFPNGNIRRVSNDIMEMYCPDKLFETTINSLDCEADCDHCWEQEYEEE